MGVMTPQGRKVNELIAEAAAVAHGVVAHAELIEAGVSVEAVRSRRRSGMLLVEFRGVYRVGHQAWTPEAWYMAAVKACGAKSVLSGRAAGWAWGLVRGIPPDPEVTSPTERRVTGVRTRARAGAPERPPGSASRSRACREP